ncbi:glycosyltransferase [Lyngbya aestuarii]|uniref:glycosyltransferase n=1 Tax=Lyngbya aestuarii TaxID=118322 RepID=UPI00403DEF84
MLSCTFPYPPRWGKIQVRTFNLLKYLSSHHSVTLVTQRSENVTDQEIEELRKWVEKLVVFSRPKLSENKGGMLEKVQRFSAFVQQGTPPSVLKLYSNEMQQWVDEAVLSGKFDVISCEHSWNEIYVRPEWQQQLRTVINIHRTCRQQLEAGALEKQLTDQLNLPFLRRYEERYCGKFTGIVVTTPEDRRQIKAYNSAAQTAVIPNGIDLTRYPKRISDPGGNRLVFIGAMDDRFNIDAVKFLSLEVFPEIRERYPEAILELVGEKPVPEVLELAKLPGITLTGEVSSVVDYLHKATVCVVSTRKGSGIKRKTLESMAVGTPVVGSDSGLEGLVVDGADVPLRALRANEPAEYVYAISRLLQNRQLRKQLSENGRALIEQKYTWQRVGERYEKILLGAKD